MGQDTQAARCDECRADLSVPSSYAHGDTLRCDNCGAQLRVLRGGAASAAPRLVMADSDPLKRDLEGTRQQIARLQGEIQTARASVGIGANGLGMGVLYVVAQVGLEEKPLSTELLVTAVIVAVSVGVLLEAANWLFLAKRKELTRLGAEMEEARERTRTLQARIREADRSRNAPRPAAKPA